MLYNHDGNYTTLREVGASDTKKGETMPADPKDLIPIAEAAEVYDRSRKWLDQQVQAGKLSVASIPGDRKVYLLHSELVKLLQPTVRRAGDVQVS